MSDIYYQKELIKWRKKELSEGHIEADFGPIYKLPLLLQAEFQTMVKTCGASGIINIHCMQQLMCNGLKVLRLNNVDYEMMENMDINISITDYNQPYKALAIEFPEKYLDSKEVRDPRSGLCNPGTGHQNQATHKPVFSIIVFEPEIPTIFVTVFMTSQDAYTTLLTHQSMTIEEELTYRKNEGPVDGSLEIGVEEEKVYREITRASLNACLFVEDFGMKLVGPHNPGLYDRQQRHLQQRQKSGRDTDQVRRELRNHPKIYEISQEVKLQIKKSTIKMDHVPTGRHVKSHWRRGHYRIQHYGKGNSLRKRIRINPVLINAEDFFGEPSNSTTFIHD